LSTARPNSYISGLQAYRGLAAAAVVFDHLHFHSALQQGPGLAPDAFRYGHLGVDFFFVLSGFIIQHVHGSDAGHPERAGDYAWRRFARIWPLLAALTTLKLVYMLASGEGVRAEKFEFATIATSYLCLPLPGWPSTGWPVLDVAWTLRHEALFYAAFLVPIVFGRAAWRVLVGAWLAWIALVLARGTQPPFPTDFLAAPLNAEFLLGVATAIAVERWRPPPARALAELLCGLVLAGLGVWAYASAETETAKASRLVLALGLALVIHASVALESAGRLRMPRSLCALGDASYSLYLWHGFVVAGALAVWPNLPDGLRAWPRVWLYGVAFASIASSLLVHRWLERPLTELFRRLRPRRTPG
jgi:peptidoglycan/LPS O-acetylase OafA/YrhL